MKKCFPLAARTPIKDTIVDDITTSICTREEGLQLVSQLQNLVGAWMSIHKWGSSDQEVLASIPAKQRAKVIELKTKGGKDSDHGILTLGMRWSTEKDELTFHLDAPWLRSGYLGRFWPSFSSYMTPMGW